MEKRKQDTSTQHMHGATVKRRKLRLQLNNLHMDILGHVISKLPIEEAVRTRTLSTQWEHIPLYHKHLLFSFHTVIPKRFWKRSWTTHGERLNDQEFIKRVNTVLQQHCGAGVEKLEVDYTLENEHAEHIDRWVNFAIASKTKHLSLDFSSTQSVSEPYNFPFQFLNAANSLHLQSLKLGSVSIKLPADFKGFPNLRRFQLVNVDTTDEDIQVLLSKCSALEFLGIIGCEMLTSLRTSHPANQLKHLVVNHCPSLGEIELNYGLTTLEYGGPLIPLAPLGTLMLTNICIEIRDIYGALEYIFTNLPSTLPHLEILTLKCHQFEVATLPDNPTKFKYLKYMRLELPFHGMMKKKTDVLDFACLLEAAPFMEKLDFHMWMHCDHLRYRKSHGALRSLPSCPHSHLKTVYITGFYGQKDQLELALHILMNSVVLEAMKIDPKPLIAADCAKLGPSEKFNFVDGSRVAMKYLCKADHRNVVHVIKVSRKDVEDIPTHHLVDPAWIEFLSNESS